METNKAPEKIYVHELSAPELTEKLPCHIEYIRTDAFIEKAAEWISNNCYIPHATLEDFKKAMKL